MTPKQRQQRVEMQYRDRLYWSEKPAVERIEAHLVRLMRCSTSRNDRMMLWRLIVDAALAAHEQELNELDALCSLKADPHMEIPIA